MHPPIVQDFINVKRIPCHIHGTIFILDFAFWLIAILIFLRIPMMIGPVANSLDVLHLVSVLFWVLITYHGV